MKTTISNLMMWTAALSFAAGCVTEDDASLEVSEAEQAMESGSTAAFDWQWRSGALLTMDGTRATRYCTGTLVAANRVVTAASCEPRLNDVVLFYTTSSSVNELTDRTIIDIDFPAGVNPFTDDLTDSANDFADIAILTLSSAAPSGTSVATVAWQYPAGGDDAGFKVGAGEHDVNTTSAQLLTKSDFTYSDHDNDGHFLTENQQTDREDNGGPFYFNRQVLGVLHGSAWEWANRDKYASTAQNIGFVLTAMGYVWPGGVTLSNRNITGTMLDGFWTPAVSNRWTVCRYACDRTSGCQAVSLTDDGFCRLFSSWTGTTEDFNFVSSIR